MKRSGRKSRKEARAKQAEADIRAEKQAAKESYEGSKRLLETEKKIAQVAKEILKLRKENKVGTQEHTDALIKQQILLQQGLLLRAEMLENGENLKEVEDKVNQFKKRQLQLQGQALNFQDSIYNSLNKHLKTYKQIEVSQENLTELGETQEELLNQIALTSGVNLKAVRETAREYQDVVRVNKDLFGLIDKTMASIENVGTGKFKPTDFEGIIERINELKNSTENEVIRDAIELARELAEEYKVIADKLKEVNDLVKDYGNRVKEAGEKFESGFNRINKFINKNLPGGGALAQLFGVDKVGSQFKKNLTQNFSQIMTDRLKENPMQAPSFGPVYRQALAQTVKQMLPKLAALAGLLFLAVMAFFMNMFDKMISKIVKDMGITRAEAAGFVRDTQQMAVELGAASVYAEQLVEAANKIREGFGGIDIAARVRTGNTFAKELVKTGAVLSDKFDLSGQEIAGLSLTGVMFNKTLTQTTNIAVNMAKGVRSVKDTLKDIASIPAKISAGFAGNIAQLVAMVNNAKLLGTSVESIRNMSENLLDIETSVAKQFEAQVLTGRQMDFDRARYFSLMGRDDLAFQETLSQVGSLKQFKQFTPIAQKSIAEAAGFDVEEMSRILGRQELIQKLGISKEEFDSMLQRGENITAMIEKRKQDGLVSEEDYNELRKLSEEYDSTTILDKLKRMAITLGNAIALLFEPFVEYLRQFMANGGDQVIRSLGQSLASMAKAVLSIATALGPIGTMGFMGAVAGGVIGSFFGGPYGALIGAGIGGTLGVVAGAVGGANAQTGYGSNVINQTPPAVINDQTRGYNAYSEQNSDTNKHLADISNSLKSIDQQTKTPARITIGDKSISEIGNVLSLTKNYVTGLDNVYNTVQSSNYRA